MLQQVQLLQSLELHVQRSTTGKIRMLRGHPSMFGNKLLKLSTRNINFLCVGFLL